MGGLLAKAHAPVNVSGLIQKGAVDVKDLINIAPGAWKDMIAKGAVEGRVDVRDLIAAGAVAKGAVEARVESRAVEGRVESGAVEGRMDIKDLIASGAFSDMARAEGVVKDLVHSGAIDFGRMIAEGAIRGTVRMDASAHDLIQKGAFTSEVKVHDLFPQLREIVGFKLPLDEMFAHVSKHMNGILLLFAFGVACRTFVAILNSHNAYLLLRLPEIPIYIKYGLALALLITFLLPVLRSWRSEFVGRWRVRQHIASELKKAAFAPVPPLPFDSLTCGINVVMMRPCGRKSVRYVCTISSIERNVDGGFAILKGCRPTCRSDRILNESPLMSVTKEEWDGPSSLVRPVTRMLIYGATGVGKTSLLKGLGVALPHGAISDEPRGTTKEVNSWFHTIGSHLFEFVDVPGAGDSDVRPPTVMRDLANIYTESSFQGMIVVVRATDTRMGTDGEVVARLLGLALGENPASWRQRVYFVVTHMDCVRSEEAQLDRIKTKMVPDVCRFLGGEVLEDNIVPVAINHYFRLEQVLLQAASKLSAMNYRHVSTEDMIGIYSQVNAIDYRESFWKDYREQMQKGLREKLKAMTESFVAPRSVSPSHVRSLLAEAEELGIHDEFQDVVRKLADWEKDTLRCLRSIEVMIDQNDFHAQFKDIRAKVQQLPFDTRLEVALGHAGVKQVEWQCSKIRGEVSDEMRRKLHEQQDKARKDMNLAEAFHRNSIEGLGKQLRHEKQEMERNLKRMRSEHEKDMDNLRRSKVQKAADDKRKQEELESELHRQKRRVETLEKNLAEAKKSKRAERSGISFEKLNWSRDRLLPSGYRLATAEEVEAHKDKVARLLNHWDICKLAGSYSFDGAGYGNMIFRSDRGDSYGHCIVVAPGAH